MSTSLALLCLPFLAAALAAQGRVWIVDANGGGNFTTLPAAVAAANDGDLIRIRAASYISDQSVTISKGLTILMEPAGVLLFALSGINVQNLPAGRQVVLSGLKLGISGFVSLTNNQGRVLLDRCVAQNGGLVISSCVQVQINACSFPGGSKLGVNEGPPALEVASSTVSISDSLLYGMSATGSLPFLSAGSAGLIANTATLTISGGQISGGDGSSALPNVSAIRTTNCRTTIRGGAMVVAGSRIGSAAAPGIASDGTLELDPSVTVAGSPPISGAFTRTWLPALRAAGAPPNGVVNADLASPPGDVLLFAASLSSDPVSLAATGVLWLDPLLFFITGVAVQGASGRTAHAVPLPGDPYLPFQGWTLQGLSGTLAGGFKLTNPVGVAIH